MSETALFPEMVSSSPVALRSPPQEDAIQALAKKQVGWKPDAWWYLIEVINDAQIMITGDVPIGFKKDGSHKWARGKDARPCRVVVARAEYREHCDAWKAEHDFKSTTPESGTRTGESE